MSVKTVKLKDIVDVLNGYAFKSSKYVSSGYKVMRITNVQKGTLVDDDPKYYEQSNDLNRYELRVGDILISLTGNVGRVGLVDESILPAYLNQRVGCLRIKSDKVCNEYLFHWLNNDSFEDNCIRNSNGIAQLNLSTEWLKDVEIQLPSLDEQKKIAKILDKADEIREKKKLANEKLDEFLKSTFISMFGDPKTNSKHLQTSKIKDLCKVQTGSTPKRDVESYYKDADIPWIKTGEVINQYICGAKEFISEKAVKETNCKLFPINTILVAMYGQGLTRGRVGMLKIEASTNQACSAILPSEKINQEFLYNQLKMQYQTLRDYGRGGNQPNLNMDIIKNFEVIVPPIEDQNKFAKIVEKVEAQKQKNEKVIEQMDNLFNSLSKRAFNVSAK